MTRKRTLLVTLPPFEGGVPFKTAMLADYLVTLGHTVTIGYYATYGYEPDLVAPIWRIPRGGRPKKQEKTTSQHITSVGIGCWLPELEVTYYTSSKLWDQLLDQHDYHIAVGGNVLTGNRLIRHGLPHFIWCATPFYEERHHRQELMSFPRRCFDKGLIVPILKRMEQYVLDHSDLILPVSQYSVERFRSMGRTGPIDVLTIPTDCEKFQPASEPAPEGVIGFAGRITDPRKNIMMLIEAIAIARKKGVSLSLRLTGQPDDTVQNAIQSLNIADHVTFLGYIEFDDLPSFYQSLDVFAIPSYQEGLGIVGVEAMATGLPIVSTRNGGSEDYVIDEDNGILVDFSADEMATALMRLVSDRSFRDRAGRRSREIALSRYSHKTWHAGIEKAWQQVWGEAP